MVQVTKPMRSAQPVRRRHRLKNRYYRWTVMLLVLGIIGFLWTIGQNDQDGEGFSGWSMMLRATGLQEGKSDDNEIMAIGEDEFVLPADQDPMQFLPKWKHRAKPLPLKSKVPYLGILVDAGRNYYPVRWLKALVDYMEKLGYNWLHLRLSDDQAFAFRSSKHSRLATACPDYEFSKHRQRALYSGRELRALVRYAQKRKIRIVPELNIPGHAASWFHIPGLVMPCPRFTCTYGYGVPLNISSPLLLPILKDLLLELKSIFHTNHRKDEPFYLHLGGDETHLAEPCFQELGLPLPDYSQFERDLANLLRELNIDSNHVLRWEQTPPDGIGYDDKAVATGNITHYWLDDFVKTRREGPLPSPRTFFVSNGLYMDVNGDDGAFAVFEATRRLVQHKPLGIVVGTFELGPDWWMQRNVFGRMIAVSMGAAVGTPKSIESPWIRNETLFAQEYTTHCTSLLDSTKSQYDVCSWMGAPPVSYAKWRDQSWQHRINSWKLHVCLRLTDEAIVHRMKEPMPSSNQYATKKAEEIARAQQIFVEHRRDPNSKERPTQSFETNKHDKLQASAESYSHVPIRNPDALFQHKVGHTGVIVDLSRFFFPLPRLKQIISTMSKLGFNTLHLRLTDDSSFAVRLNSHPDIAFGPRKDGPVYTTKGLKELTFHAHRLGVAIIPEINFVSRGGGWFPSGFVSPCPEHVCNKGGAIPLNLTDTQTFAVLSNIIEELQVTFNSPFLHLGYDERLESLPCFKEAKIDNVNFDEVERQLMALMTVLGISSRHILRWESSEYRPSNRTGGESGRQRSGLVTHYYRNNPSEDIDMPFFVSTDLRFDQQDDDAYEIYKVTRGYSSYSSILGILGGTFEMGPQAWNGRNMDGKLVAMAIGAAAIDVLNIDEFKRLYRDTCKAIGLEGDHSDLFGNARWSEKNWRTEMTNDRRRRVNATCNRLTGTVRMRVAKPGVVGKR